MKLLKLILLLGITLSIAYLWRYTDKLNTIEKTAPWTTTTTIPQIIGKNVEGIRIEAHDNKSGIREFSLYLTQGEITSSLEKILYADPVLTHISEPKTQDIHTTFKEGNAKLALHIKDASIWGNELIQEFNVVLDFKSPKLSVVSRQHLAVQGGAEFVLLEASDTTLKEVGVMIDSYTFKAIPAESLDTEFTGSNIYASLFALPLEIDNPQPKAYARDEAGNLTAIPLSFRVKPYRLRNTAPNVSEGFVQEKVKPLFDEYLSELSAEERINIDSEDPITLFRTVNENYRAALQDKLSRLPLSNNPLPSDQFIKPMASATTSNFGELRAYTVNGKPAGGSRHDGLDLASVLRDSVVATNSGKVIFADSLGIYGNAVVIDHGMYLTSLYGHLSSISVSTGEHVSQGQEIGRSGTSGLAGGDHLHFEFRINNVPVTPIEWWDPHWIKDHITGKTDEAKRQYLKIE